MCTFIHASILKEEHNSNNYYKYCTKYYMLYIYSNYNGTCTYNIHQ